MRAGTLVVLAFAEARIRVSPAFVADGAVVGVEKFAHPHPSTVIPVLAAVALAAVVCFGQAAGPDRRIARVALSAVVGVSPLAGMRAQIADVAFP